MSDQAAEKGSLEGAELRPATADDRRAAVEQAVDYRGDVTIHTADGQSIQGYIFDRREDVSEPYLRMIPADGSARRTVLYRDIERIAFTGRDSASGKSWETWIKKYQEKKARGEKASLESEPLDEGGKA